jgi:membrane protein YdbS with pleckstrin-like domain
MEESSVWRGTSSQILNFGVFFVCGVGAALLLTPVGLTLAGTWKPPTALLGALLILSMMLAGVAFWRWLYIRSRVYEITSERIQITHGILSRRTDFVELYRVKDLTVLRPLLLRLFALGNVVMETSDRSTPQVMLQAVSQPKALNDLIRKHVESCHDHKRVGELDMSSHAVE